MKAILSSGNIEAQTFAIVDDHRNVASAIAFALESALNLKCAVQCYNVKEAKTRLIEARPRIVVLDWRLDDGSGADVLLSCAPHLPQARWLLFTAVPTPLVMKEAAAARIHGAVSKTAELSELVHAVRELLAGRSFYCSVCLAAIMRIWQGLDSQTHLTRSECEVIRRVSRGLEAKAIAAEMNLSVKTVHNTLAFIRTKCGMGSLVDIARFAEREGLA